jgi:hypothetical protein
MNITPKSLIDSKEFAGDVRRSEAEDLRFYGPLLEMFFERA